LVQCLGWDAPLLDALVHNIRNERFKLRVYASDLRRAKLAPLFRDWIPDDCTVQLSDGSGLAKLCLPGVVSISYSVIPDYPIKLGSIRVMREVRCLGRPAPISGNISTFPNDWLADFKDDVVAHYAIEKSIASIGPEKRALDTRISGPHRFVLDVFRRSGPVGPSLFMRASFEGYWECLWVEFDHMPQGFTRRDFTFPNKEEPWGVQKYPQGDFLGIQWLPPDRTGLEPLALHESIAEEFGRLKELYREAKSRKRDQSPTRT
jgi:hypothetical protein